MGDKKIYVIAKIFDQQGCLAYSCKTPYKYVDDMKEYIDLVSRLNTVA